MPLDLYPPVQRDPLINPEDTAMEEIERESPHLTEPTAPMRENPVPVFTESPTTPLVPLAGPSTEAPAAPMAPLAGPTTKDFISAPAETTAPLFQATPQPGLVQPATEMPPFMAQSAPVTPEAPQPAPLVSTPNQSMLAGLHRLPNLDLQTNTLPSTTEAIPSQPLQTTPEVQAAPNQLPQPTKPIIEMQPVAEQPRPVAVAPESTWNVTKQLAEEMSKREENWTKIMANRANVGNTGNQYEELTIP